MKALVKLEYLSLFVLSLLLFRALPYPWWWYPALFLVPDIGMVGYLLNPRIGSVVYNVVHVIALGIAIYVLGYLMNAPGVELVGVILLGHTSLDRVFGYGLKYPDSFTHTHLD